MSSPSVQAGDFVWCAFPERENPARPGPRHLAYMLAISGVTGVDQYAALTAYTTTKPWPGSGTATSAIPFGVHVVDVHAAASMGQSRPFVIDLRRLAYLQLTAAWFPPLHQPGGGRQGRATKPLQRLLMRDAELLLTRHRDLVERLGPLWPRGSD